MAGFVDGYSIPKWVVAEGFVRLKPDPQRKQQGLVVMWVGLQPDIGSTHVEIKSPNPHMHIGFHDLH